ncbi:hypothetical protein [Aquiflexum gelatinilyticum]|uniref:Uncharacterized protein n=1 Tax=Aquiflexum gelatinilyticum TaxID=2961943 RepID=A0A9X2P665_9BACT|nr:hypothetical protein [Aquiflexum gelatinilyticum]MCR9016763.1 hypothetical protein [Aquiflexum gelatinilyticum]
MKPTILNQGPAFSKLIKAFVFLIGKCKANKVFSQGRIWAVLPVMIPFLLSSCNEDMDAPTIVTINHHVLKEAYPVHRHQTYLLDLNEDDIPDFSINVMSVGFDQGVREYFQINSLRDSKVILTNEEIAPLTSGLEISEASAIEGSSWSVFTGSMMVRTITENQPDQWSGPWAPDGDYFVGLSVRVNGEYHYGWVKLQADKESHAMFIQEYAFQTIPNLRIKAGQRK